MQYIRNLGSLVLLAAVAAGTAGWGLGKVELNHHECYVALAARGMTSQTQWLDDHLFEKPVPEATTLNRWMVPQCTGEPRLRKTPLAYWAVAGLVKAGLPLDEVTARLPSLIASVLAVLVIFGVGRRMIGPRAAMMGALMLAASVGLLKWGRDARPELLLMLWMTVAMACFWTGMQAATGRKRAAWLLAGWAAMGLANLSKEFVPLFLVWPLLAYLAWRASAQHDARPRLRLGVFLILALAGVVLVDVIRRFEALQWWQGGNLNATVCSALTYGCLIGLPLLGYFLVCRPWGQLKLVLPTLGPGLVLMTLLFVPWLVYLDILFPATGDTLWQQVGARGVGSEGWTSLRTPGFYLASIVTLTLPWIIFLPGAVLAPLLSAPARRPEDDEQSPAPLSAMRPDAAPQHPTEHVDGLVYLLFWVFGLTLLFSAAAGKRVHYILPAIPALCMLAGYAAEDVFFRHRWFTQGMGKAIMVGHAVVGVLAAIATAGASQAASKGWIADVGDAIIEPLIDSVSVAQVAEVAGYLLIPVAVTALLLCAAAWAHLRNRPALSFAGFVGAAIVLVLSLGNRPALLDESPNARVEAGWIRGKVPASAPISMWDYNRSTEPLTFAIGHDMPNASLAREAMIARHGRQEGMRLWEDWMRQDGGRWLLVRAKDVDEVKNMGYTMADPNHKPLDQDMDVILFQPPGRKK
jgi:4-amino-4-deoxy-L-arabinose transferase-like glycosyltransferase